MKKVIVAIVSVAVLSAAGFVCLHIYRAPRIKNYQPCWSKLANIEAAKFQWATETGATSGTPVTAESIMPYLGTMPTCHVAGATYIIGKVGEEPRCTVHGTTSHFNGDHYERNERGEKGTGQALALKVYAYDDGVKAAQYTNRSYISTFGFTRSSGMLTFLSAELPRCLRSLRLAYTWSSNTHL